MRSTLVAAVAVFAGAAAALPAYQVARVPLAQLRGIREAQPVRRP